jgi:hypothetical protein
MTVLEYIRHMQELWAISKDYLPEWFPKLEMRDIEHSLCEFDKYERARLGHGKPRSRYIPPHERKEGHHVWEPTYSSLS